MTKPLTPPAVTPTRIQPVPLAAFTDPAWAPCLGKAVCPAVRYDLTSAILDLTGIPPADVAISVGCGFCTVLTIRRKDGAMTHEIALRPGVTLQGYVLALTHTDSEFLEPGPDGGSMWELMVSDDLEPGDLSYVANLTVQGADLVAEAEGYLWCRSHAQR